MVVFFIYQSLYRVLIELTNGKVSSSLLKKFCQSKWSRPFIAPYTKVYRINLQEMESNLAAYTTLHELFIRKLKEGTRKIAQEEDAVVSPVDGILEDFGEITFDKKMLIKGKVYSLEEMLADPNTLSKYVGGVYMVLYLSPNHYHRIHSPVFGTVVRRWIRGNKSYPVNSYGLKYGRKPLSKNYRSITEVKHSSGHVAIVKIGAMFINSIVISNESESLNKGQEFAYFSFGSTVVLLFEKGSFQPEQNLTVPVEVKVGEKIGQLHKIEEAGRLFRSI
jgi:phosphatidylserine decarboxylase